MRLCHYSTELDRAAPASVLAWNTFTRAALTREMLLLLPQEVETKPPGTDMGTGKVTGTRSHLHPPALTCCLVPKARSLPTVQNTHTPHSTPLGGIQPAQDLAPNQPNMIQCWNIPQSLSGMGTWAGRSRQPPVLGRRAGTWACAAGRERMSPAQVAPVGPGAIPVTHYGL